MNQVFIIGCARSGTTWLGEILQQSPGFRVTVEHQPIFGIVDKMALYPESIPLLMPRLISLYQDQTRDSTPRIYADKSHQNIWLVEYLAEAFADAKFLGIERSAYGAIASMLKHPGVLAHFYRWRSYPVPNRHIGLTEKFVPEYDRLSLTEKCALRWKSHHQRLMDLKKRIGDRALVLSYERLVTETDHQRELLSDFLDQTICEPQVDKSAIKKWTNVLSRRQIRSIDHVLERVD